MQSCSARQESTFFRLVFTENQAHELAHAVAVVVRRPERVFLHRPARREDDKVCNRCSVAKRRASQYSEDARILSNGNDE